ncbi:MULTISPECIES: hypothetical protein [unclassified Pseudoxanthomonas]|jgi:hypothetical protein|nr:MULTISPECIES: hypothetical protein [unclassified Pseudoxanthomonas]SFV28103.1 hypothetical protein SAMN05428990_0889 [Pseudoxanthomonas sp. YR558]
MLHVIHQIQRRWPSQAHKVIPALLILSVALLALGAGLSLL